MPGQVRRTHKVFGSAGVSASPNSFYQFGSLANGSPIPTTDIATIQASPAWTAGLQNEIYPSNSASPYQEINGWMYEHSYMVGQVFQDGVPQWDAGTTYQIGSWVQDTSGLGQVFQCLQANTVGGSLPNGASNALWRWVNPPATVLSGTLAANTIPKMGAAAGTGPAGSKVLTDSLLSDDGTNVIIGGVAGTNGLKFPDGSVQQKAATSVVTNQNVVTGSRALGTNFQNTGTKPMFVSVSVANVDTGGQGIGYTIDALSDNSPTPTTNVAHCRFSGNFAYSASGDGQVFFIVLPGNYYRVSATGTLMQWIEWS